jgi:hypothetical protein
MAFRHAMVFCSWSASLEGAFQWQVAANAVVSCTRTGVLPKVRTGADWRTNGANCAKPSIGLVRERRWPIVLRPWWITGIIVFLIDKRPYVRFHAAQSIVVFAGLHIINIILGVLFGARLMMGGGGAFGLGEALHSLMPGRVRPVDSANGESLSGRKSSGAGGRRNCAESRWKVGS